MTRELLPANAVPQHYALTLTPDLEKFVFQGNVKIDVDVTQDSQSFTVNTKEIEINHANTSVVLANGTKVACTGVKYNTENDHTTMEFEQTIAPQKATLDIDFTGILNDKMAGFYRSQYKVGEESRWMASTQFEAVDARRALPCWDEPAHKATFDVTLIVPKHLVALSNMDVASTEDVEGDLKRVVFNRSPKMSTYLLAFVVGELEYVEGATSKGLPIRVYTTPGLKEDGQFACEVAAKCLDFFIEYFDISYPLPKMDMVAIPDFAAGAMENWGLVTYRSSVLLYNPSRTPEAMKQRGAYVVGHELAHQWFGNLVTMEWWTDLWLNEAFATWVGWRVVDKIFPEWKVWDQFVVGDMARGLNLDALKSSHPIEVEVNKAHEIDSIFDAISYSKGASTLRMLVNWTGEENFKIGLRQYLKEHTYANTVTVDLWRALSASTNTDITALMGPWTQQTGYPVVRVNANGETLGLSQSKYLATGSDAADKTLWPIPVSVATSGGEIPRFLFSEQTGSVPLTGVSATEGWICVNQNRTGFYRVLYEDSALPYVLRAIPHVGASDRCGFVSDAFALAVAGYSSTANALKLLSAYKEEREYIVWAEISSNLGKMRSVWAGTNDVVTNGLAKLTRELVSPLANELGWQPKAGEASSVQMLRPMLVRQAGSLGDEAIVAEAKRLFEEFAGGKTNAIHPDMLGAALAIVLRNGDAATQDRIFELYRKLDSQDQKVIVLGALGACATEELAVRSLQFAVDEVRVQDMYMVFGAIASNPSCKHVAWRFLRDNFDTVSGKLAGTMMLLGRTVQFVCEVLVSDAEAEDVRSFFAARSIPGLERSLTQALESVSTRKAWLARASAEVEAHFAA